MFYLFQAVYTELHKYINIISNFFLDIFVVKILFVSTWLSVKREREMGTGTGNGGIGMGNGNLKIILVAKIFVLYLNTNLNIAEQFSFFFHNFHFFG